MSKKKNTKISKSNDGHNQLSKGGNAEEYMDTTEQVGHNQGWKGTGATPKWFDTGHQDYQGQYQENAQAQRQHQLQRSIEASKQMLYAVFGNVITILEEFEGRELARYSIKHKMPKSDIYIPKQEHKDFEDIKSIVETQLLLFETQTKVCPPEAIAQVIEELKRRTISWSAVREEMGIKEIQQTDKYTSKLYEILAKGRTDHKPMGGLEVTKEAMKEGFQAMLHGEHDRMELDKEFKTNPDKKAEAPKTRASEQLSDGARRISQAKGGPELDNHLKEDMKIHEQQGPENIK